jgi:tetratricopeptide (TPR) repeat protein
MCTVYAARDVKFDRVVALKLLHSKVSAKTDEFKRFHREATVVADMSHPNIVEVYGFGVSADGAPYMAMELLRGSSLDTFIREGPLPVPVALPIFLQICDALSHAHSKGIVHRDLKPSNVMLIGGTADGAVKLVDFGIARLMPESGKHAQKVTQTGELIGTIAYMSPEQCAGDPLDARSDIYSMGCLMYQVLSAQLPFSSNNTMEMVARHMYATPRPVPNVPLALSNVIVGCLSKAPSDRPQSAAELKEYLQNPSSYIPKSQSTARKKFKLPMSTAALVTCFLVLGIGLSIIFPLVTPAPVTAESTFADAMEFGEIHDWKNAIAKAQEAKSYGDERFRAKANTHIAKWHQNLACHEEAYEFAGAAINFYEPRGELDCEEFRLARIARGLSGMKLEKDDAQTSLMQALNLSESKTVNDPPRAAMARYYLGRLYARTDPAKAEGFYELALRDLEACLQARARYELAEVIMVWDENKTPDKITKARALLKHALRVGRDETKANALALTRRCFPQDLPAEFRGELDTVQAK